MSHPSPSREEMASLLAQLQLPDSAAIQAATQRLRQAMPRPEALEALLSLAADRDAPAQTSQYAALLLRQRLGVCARLGPADGRTAGAGAGGAAGRAVRAGLPPWRGRRRRLAGAAGRRAGAPRERLVVVAGAGAVPADAGVAPDGRVRAPHRPLPVCRAGRVGRRATQAAADVARPGARVSARHARRRGRRRRLPGRARRYPPGGARGQRRAGRLPAAGRPGRRPRAPTRHRRRGQGAAGHGTLRGTLPVGGEHERTLERSAAVPGGSSLVVTAVEEVQSGHTTTRTSVKVPGKAGVIGTDPG